MIQIEGQLMGIVEFKNRDGEQKSKLQLLGHVPMPDGGSKFDLMDVSVKNPEQYRGLETQTVTVPVGCFAPQKGTVIFFESNR